MVLSRRGVSELGKIQSWEVLGDATGDTRLARWISTSYQQQLFLQAAFFPVETLPSALSTRFLG